MLQLLKRQTHPSSELHSCDSNRACVCGGSFVRESFEFIMPNKLIVAQLFRGPFRERSVHTELR